MPSSSSPVSCLVDCLKLGLCLKREKEKKMQVGNEKDALYIEVECTCVTKNVLVIMGLVMYVLTLLLCINKDEKRNK